MYLTLPTCTLAGDKLPKKLLLAVHLHIQITKLHFTCASAFTLQVVPFEGLHMFDYWYCRIVESKPALIRRSLI